MSGQVVECLRRLMLTGLLVFALPDTPAQVAFGCIFAFLRYRSCSFMAVGRRCRVNLSLPARDFEWAGGICQVDPHGVLAAWTDIASTFSRFTSFSGF